MDKKKRCKRGSSSFGMNDATCVFDALALDKGNVFLDLGCGPGEYSIAAANAVGVRGQVYGIDMSDQSLGMFKSDILNLGLENIQVIKSDILHPFPITAESVDVCFISTVLHIYDVDQIAPQLFAEISRVLKKEGRLVILECKKEKTTFGPPIEMRYSPVELETVSKIYGYRKHAYTDLGHNYMIQFKRVE